MPVIWWTIYILGSLTILIIWINLMGLLGSLLKAVRDKEWRKVEVVSGPPGPKGPKGDSCSLTRKDIEALIRMEVAANISCLEISRTTYPGLGKDEFKIGLRKDKNLGDWQTNQSPVDVDKLINEYHDKKEDK